MRAIDLPLAAYADGVIQKLASATGSAALAKLVGATLLYERAVLSGMVIPARTSAGGGCRLFDAMGDSIALNLSRPADRELLPALFETDDLETNNDVAIATLVSRSDADALLARGRLMGLAIAAEHEKRSAASRPCTELVAGLPSLASIRHAPRVLDLSALWAGPLATHLLWIAGAKVIKVESCSRPDAMRDGDPTFYALLNQGKASVVLDFERERQALLSLIKASDIVIEAARPRALAQLGIDAAELVRTTPGLVWITITAHGAEGEAADWVGFGDDCSVAGGLSAALRTVTHRTGFVGDAIADPLTGICAALAAWQAWSAHRGGRFGVSMSHIVARAIADSRAVDSAAFEASLQVWSNSVGTPFPTMVRRHIGSLPAFGENTQSYLAMFASC